MRASRDVLGGELTSSFIATCSLSLAKEQRISAQAEALVAVEDE